MTKLKTTLKLLNSNIISIRTIGVTTMQAMASKTIITSLQRERVRNSRLRPITKLLTLTVELTITMEATGSNSNLLQDKTNNMDSNSRQTAAIRITNVIVRVVSE